MRLSAENTNHKFFFFQQMDGGDILLTTPLQQISTLR